MYVRDRILHVRIRPRDIIPDDEIRIIHEEKFSTAAATLFGSGWAWLSVKADGTLAITQESNAGNPLRDGLGPILTCDVWEHAYYLDKQNLRPKYIEDFWNLVDWSAVASRL